MCRGYTPHIQFAPCAVRREPDGDFRAHNGNGSGGDYSGRFESEKKDQIEIIHVNLPV
jgi:hypothetical protein